MDPDCRLAAHDGGCKPEAVASAHRIAGIGEVGSDAKGSGARYNAGKAPFDLVPINMLACYWRAIVSDGTPEQKAAAEALAHLGEYQKTGNTLHLWGAIEALGGEGWRECAEVFGYGKRKYAAWNWAKGMAWSVPLACAARHLLAILGGESHDPESTHAHRGHVFCNVVMLLQYTRTFVDGNDLPIGVL